MSTTTTLQAASDVGRATVGTAGASHRRPGSAAGSARANATQVPTAATVPPCPSWCTRRHDPNKAVNVGAIYHSAEPVQTQISAELLRLTSVTNRVSGELDSAPVISIGDHESSSRGRSRCCATRSGENWSPSRRRSKPDLTTKGGPAGETNSPAGPWPRPFGGWAGPQTKVGREPVDHLTQRPLFGGLVSTTSDRQRSVSR